VELWWDRILGDVLIVRRKSVSLKAEGAYPQSRSHIDLAKRVEYCPARRFAGNGLIL